MKLHWGNYIFIFILFFLTLCTVFIIFSLRQDIDLVTDAYYEEGADYTSEMQIAERSAVYFDSITIIQDKTRLEVQLSKSLSLDIQKINVWFYRPSDKDSDFETELIITDEPLFVSKDHLIKGRYIMHISWDSGEEEFIIKKNIFIN
jgi:hypothetical protein